MNYENLENEIVARLTPFMTAGITVEKIPELESERQKPLPTKAKFTVIYAGSEYGSALSTAQISQEEKIFIQILIESTFLRGSFGVYNLASLLKKALTGFQPSGCRRMQVTKHHTSISPPIWTHSSVRKSILFIHISRIPCCKNLC